MLFILSVEYSQSLNFIGFSVRVCVSLRRRGIRHLNKAIKLMRTTLYCDYAYAIRLNVEPNNKLYNFWNANNLWSILRRLHTENLCCCQSWIFQKINDKNELVNNRNKSEMENGRREENDTKWIDMKYATFRIDFRVQVFKKVALKSFTLHQQQNHSNYSCIDSRNAIWYCLTSEIERPIKKRPVKCDWGRFITQWETIPCGRSILSAHH